MWRAYLGLTMQGLLGPRLEGLSGTVEQELNEHDAVSVTFTRRSLDGVERKWWSYRSGCIVVTFTDDHGIERLVSAAPISAPAREDRAAGTVTLTGKGVSWLLEDRLVIDDNTFGGSAWKKGALSYKKLSFSAICASIVHEATTGNPNTALPIVLPSRTTAGKHQRTYEAWNLANNWAWDRLHQITQVIGGPDLAFRPEWVDDSRTSFRWRLLVGTDAQQTLPQSGEVLWDATTHSTMVTAMTVMSEASSMSHQTFVIGAGEGAGISVYSARAKTIASDMPFIQHTFAVSGNDEDVEEGENQSSPVLEAAARAEVVSQGTDQVNLTVTADGRDGFPIGSWHCGELARVKTAGWLQVPDGEHLLRIVGCDYDLEKISVAAKCQEDQLGRDYEW